MRGQRTSSESVMVWLLSFRCDPAAAWAKVQTEVRCAPLRAPVSVSFATGRPFRIENIRATRQKPGLLRQHLTAVHAAVDVGSGEVEGAALGSMALTFVQGKVRGGDHPWGRIIHQPIPHVVLSNPRTALPLGNRRLPTRRAIAHSNCRCNWRSPTVADLLPALNTTMRTI